MAELRPEVPQQCRLRLGDSFEGVIIGVLIEPDDMLASEKRLLSRVLALIC